ncbi:uncharacterized protein B0I36DRAFT_359419 [Microdochium trichocladiopsis]|uniref:Uncharacterized protein n=1 Tax=Microdochium trichocladiopsis TaxID=1682393 RepID=A0A9P8YGP3_9PEZI|nr:uncharacterized protein B0I36DRAFT_359419 [Microdochium trichocladiopsis]KAH7037770.1 hypothetical protein B0I36DRAFT_359419 [Microdochium trichocladiopsis]
MSQPPSTPVKVPSSAANYTPATLDPDLRSQINTLLIREGHITKIQERLLHSLDSHNANWPTAIQAHALSLLRNGEVSTFPALIKRVLEDVRHETATAASSSTSTSGDADSASASNGTTSAANGTSDKKGVNGTSSNGTVSDGGNSLAVPAAVVETVLKVTRESLEAVCEIDNSSSSGGGG